MAAVAIPRRTGVYVVFVTGGTGLSGVDPDQRIAAVVVEARLIPIRIRYPVANFARCRKTDGDVVRVPRLLVIPPVAAVAIPRRTSVHVVFVTGGTGLRGVDPDQRIAAVVVEARLVPVRMRREVTELAARREPGGDVIWARGSFIILPVAGKTGETPPLEIFILMAAVAAQSPVLPAKGKSCPGGMVPIHGDPGDGTVTFFALAPQLGLVAVILTSDPMAIIATDGGSFVNTVEMAGGAGHLKVPSFEGKYPCLMEGARDRPPGLRLVTGRAGLGHPSLMGIGMTGRAGRLVGQVGPDLVAGGTIIGEGGMLSLERKPGFSGVVEILWVEGAEIDVNALMFLVAGLAVAADIAVDALLRLDPRSNRLVARQATLWIDLGSPLVAFQTIRRAFEGAVSFGKRARRFGGFLLRSTSRHSPEGE
jgi:hypothetical protein